MSEKATILVSEAKEVSSGEGQYGPWTLYHVIDGNEDRYSTFKKELYDDAKRLEGKRAEIEYTTNDKGKTFTSIVQAAASDNGDTPKLGTGEYKTGQKPIIEARRIFASTAWNNAVKAAELEFKMQAVTRETTPDLIETAIKRYADLIFLDLTRKGDAIRDEDLPFLMRGEDVP